MTRIIRLDPVTRISGFLEVDVEIENNRVINAKTIGHLFRGFEKMLNGRSPFDAVYFTQRICGICSTAHSIAATLALEDALSIAPSEQGKYLRDIIHGCEFLQNHIRHFYQYTVPDFVKMPENNPLFAVKHSDFRLPKVQNDLIVSHYFESLSISRSAHEMLAVLGGKAPHNHGVFIGGITTQPTTDKIIKIKSILQNIKEFINTRMIPDVHVIANFYNEYFSMGKGYGNLLSFGCFDRYKDLGTIYVDPLVYQNGQTSVFNPNEITEEIDHSWYVDPLNTYKPMETITQEDMTKEEAYSWIKAARYHNAPFEVGPLARQWLSGEYRNGISTMDRIIARVLEARKIGEVIELLLNHVTPGVSLQGKYLIPKSAEGKGLVDTTRGALGHWMKITDSLISFYQIITPSVWNLSSQGNDNLKGTAEQTLIGTKIQDLNHPVELGRIIRSFDPCVSCATHVFTQGKCINKIQVVP